MWSETKMRQNVCVGWIRNEIKKIEITSRYFVRQAIYCSSEAGTSVGVVIILSYLRNNAMRFLISRIARIFRILIKVGASKNLSL